MLDTVPNDSKYKKIQQRHTNLRGELQKLGIKDLYDGLLYYST